MNNDLNSGILNGHYELGRRPRQPAYPGKVECDSKCGSILSNQAGRVGPPKTEGFLFVHSKLDASLINAYSETEYRVTQDSSFVLKVGVPSSKLAALYKTKNVSCAAFITACNPLSKQLSETDNVNRQSELSAELKRRSLSIREGVGRHPSGDWPGEPSFLVLGLSLEAAKSLGMAFEQNAIIWCGPDAVPNLVLLR